MKKLTLFASILALAACGTTTNTTTSVPATPLTPAESVPPQRGMALIPTTPNVKVEYLGPANMEQSNFYFAGEFQIIDGKPLFYDCMAGANIPIATNQGDYKELLNHYKNAATSLNEILRAQLRGYFVPEATEDYPKKLVVTYVNSMTKGMPCSRQEQLPGTWTAELTGAQKGTVTLNLTNTFNFSCDITTDSGTNSITGSWMMTSSGEIGLFYSTITKHLGHSVAFNPKNMTLFVPTESGTLTFKKK